MVRQIGWQSLHFVLVCAWWVIKFRRHLTPISVTWNKKKHLYTPFPSLKNYLFNSADRIFCGFSSSSLDRWYREALKDIQSNTRKQWMFPCSNSLIILTIWTIFFVCTKIPVNRFFKIFAADNELLIPEMQKNWGSLTSFQR